MNAAKVQEWAVRRPSVPMSFHFSNVRYWNILDTHTYSCRQKR